MMQKISFYIRNTFGVLFILLLASWLLSEAINESSRAGQGNSAVILGLLAGFVPVMTEFVIAWRRGELFIRDKVKIESKQAHNKHLAKVFFVPAVILGIALAHYSGPIKIVFISASVGYLLPYSIFLLIHFAKHHKEIENLTKDLS